MDCYYIVRIYRRNGLDPEGMVGQVEAVSTGTTSAFKGPDELLAILDGRKSRNEKNELTKKASINMDRAVGKQP